MFGMIVGILFAVYVIAAVLELVGVIIGAVFSGVGLLLDGMFAFSWEGLAVGIALGLVWYFLRKKNAARS